MCNLGHGVALPEDSLVSCGSEPGTQDRSWSGTSTKWIISFTSYLGYWQIVTSSSVTKVLTRSGKAAACRSPGAGGWREETRPDQIRWLNLCLRFHLSDDLKDGRMQVKHDESSGDLRFVAYLASDIWPRIELDRTLQISALIGALARLPKELEGIEPEDMPAVAQEIHDRLEHAGVPTWTRSEYDPVLAATAIEPFDQRESDES